MSRGVVAWALSTTRTVSEKLQRVLQTTMPESGTTLPVTTSRAPLLFEWDRKIYLLVVDYFSRFIEIFKLSQTTAADIINHTKSIFARKLLFQTTAPNMYRLLMHNSLASTDLPTSLVARDIPREMERPNGQ